MLFLLIAGCLGSGKDTADTAGSCVDSCPNAAYRTEDFQSAEKEQACVFLDGSTCETVISVQRCLDSTCFPDATEDVSDQGFRSFFGGSTQPPYDDGQYCVDNDKTSLYRFTILYCADDPPSVNIRL